MRRTMLVLCALALGGCDGVLGPRDDVSAYVVTLDQDGDPLRADAVAWYYDPLGERFDGEHPAECIDRRCSIRVIPAEVTEPVFVTGTWTRPVPGSAYCHYHGADGKPVTPSTDDPPTVVLRLNTRAEACE